MSSARRSPKAIFLEAIEKALPEELACYLAEACGDDAGLRAEVEDLLRAHERAGRFLGGSFASDSTVSLPPVSEQPGMQIGPYKLRERLGEGGMGVVFVAEQKDPVKRRVALKIIKPGMDTREVIARFEAERQALAMMDHPNIARVLDAGQTDSGHPFFAMELVNGLPITDYCDQQRLSLRDRLELFIPVCHAVQHAHQKGIIHRDLKPSNVLVAMYDGEPVPKVIDFGVAKATSQTLTEKTIYTQLGQVVGTLEYMSPEQAQRNQLDIDTRSDVYSLGVILYELLTGETPIDRQRLRSAAFDEILRIIRDEEPPRPSTKLSSSQTLPAIAANRRVEPKRLSTLVRGELDWIVMKALDKERARRYDTANGLAADISNYLHDAPVAACPPSAMYQLQKFLRRYKELAATSALVVAALLIGIVTTSWQGWVARRERDRAVFAEGLADDRLVAEQSARAETERALADRRESLVRLYVRTGTEHVDRGDHTRALPWFLKAFELEQDDPDRAKIHRLRIAMTLDRCPKLTHVLWPDHVVGQIQFFADGRRVLLTGAGHATVWDTTSGMEVDFPLAGSYHLLGPLGQRLVLFRGPEQVCVLDGDSGQTVRQLPAGPNPPTFAGFSRDSAKMFVVYGNHTIRVWDPRTGEPLSPLLEEPVERIVGAAFNSDGRYLIVADNQPGFPDIAIVWDLESNQVVDRIPINHGLRDHHARNLVAGKDWFAVPADVFVFVGTLPNGNHRQAWLRHSDQVRTLRISDDANMLLSSSIDNTVRVWRPQAGSPLTEPLEMDASVYAADFSRDGHSVATGAVDGRVAHWSLPDGHLASPTLQHPDDIRAVCFGPENRRLVTASAKGGVRVWDLAAVVPAPELQREQPHGAEACAAFSEDGKRIALSFVDYTAKIYDLASRAYLKPLIEHQDVNTVTRVDRDGRRLYSVCRSGEIVCADLQTGEVLFRNDQPVLPPTGTRGEPVSITMNGKPYIQARTILDLDEQRQLLYVATGYTTRDGNPNVSRLFVFDAETGESRGDPFEFAQPISKTLITPDGQFWIGAFGGQAADSPDYRVEIRRLPGLGLERTIPVDAPPWALDISRDGVRLLVGIGLAFSGAGAAQVYDFMTGQPLTRPMRHRGAVVNCRFLAHDKLVLANDQEGTVRVWHSDSGKPAAPAIRVGRWVRSLDVSPDELWIAGGTGSNNNKGQTEQFLQLWDIRTAQRINPPIAHNDSVMSLDISPAGDRIATASRDRFARVFAVPREARTCDQLSALAELVTGIRIDSTETPVPITAGAFRQRWDELVGRYPEEFTTSEAEQIAWLRYRFDLLKDRSPLESAKETLDRLIPLDPNDSYLYRNRIDVCRRLGLWDAVQADIEAVARLEGLRGRRLAKLAAETTWGAACGGEFQQFVLGILDRSAQMAPEDPYPYRYRFLLRRKRGELAGAKSDLLRAIELVPSDFWPYAELAQLQLSQGDREGYAETCKKVLAGITPTNMGLVEEAVVWACSLGDVDIGDRKLLIERAEFAANSRPGSMRYQVLLGTALLRAGRYEEAYDHFLRADKLPDDSQNAWFSSPVDRYFLLAITCHRLGWAERSLQWFERAVDEVADRRAAPETSRMLRREVEQNYLEGTLVESHWATCAAKAVVLDRRGDEAAAHSAFDRAIELAGTNPQPWIARGEWHLRHGRRSEAESDFVSGFKLNTDHAQPVEIQSFLLSRVSKHCDEGRIRDAIDVLSTVDGDYSLVDRWLRVIDLAARHEDAVILTEDVVRVVEESMGWPAAAEVEYQRLAWDLLLGRTSEYHSGCRELAARYPGDSNSRYLYLTARVASLVTKPGVSTAQLVEMASKANQQFATFWREHACGLCLLRDGQHDAAVERFRQAIAIRKDDAVSDWLGLALAHAAAGRADRAEECLTKAENSIRVYPLDHTSTLHPHDRIACQILYREALRKIRPSADPPPAEGSASEPPSR